MRSFSIKELQAFANIKAHTIRTWESRYAVLAPKRTDTNIRYYTLDDVRRLLALVLLTENGFRISDLAKFDDNTIQKHISALKSAGALQVNAINNLIISMFARKPEDFEQILSDCTDTFGIASTIRDIIIPFLERTNLLSYNDSSNETHLAVTAVRKKIILGIETLANPPKPAATAVLFLPKGEHYDLILLYLAYLAKSRGMNVLYLGTNISKHNLGEIITEKKPDRLYTYISPQQEKNLSDILSFLDDYLEHKPLYIAKPDVEYYQPERKNVTYFHFKKIPA